MLPLISSCRFFSSFFKRRNSSLGITSDNSGSCSAIFKSSNSSAVNSGPEGRLTPLLSGKILPIMTTSTQWTSINKCPCMQTGLSLALNSGFITNHTCVKCINGYIVSARWNKEIAVRSLRHKLVVKERMRSSKRKCHKVNKMHTLWMSRPVSVHLREQLRHCQEVLY